MTKRAYVPEERVREVSAMAERTLTPEEFRAWADGPIPADEMAEMIDLIRWFVRRYPTPAARLRSARRRQLQLSRTIAHARRAPEARDG